MPQIGGMVENHNNGKFSLITVCCKSDLQKLIILFEVFGTDEIKERN